MLSKNIFLICNMSTSLFVECPTGVTITPAAGPFASGDVLTCSANGYDPTYTWTGSTNAVDIVAYTGSTYDLPDGTFDLTCTADISQLSCTGTISVSVDGQTDDGTAGKYRIHLNALLTIMMFMRLSLMS